MLLTPTMAVAGLIAALLQFAAHHLMRDKKYRTCVPRYIAGSAVVLACFAVAWFIEPTQHPVTALLYIYGASFVGTKAGYATDPKPQLRRKPSAEELELWSAPIASEHSDDGKAHRD